MARPPAFKPAEAVNLVENARKRDTKFYDAVAILRHYYRTGRLDRTRRFRDLNTSLWEGNFEQELETVNLALPHINTLVATTAASLPSFSVEPGFYTEQSSIDADAAYALITKFMEHDDVLRKLRRMGLDQSVLGEGWGFVGWLEVTEDLEDDEYQAAVQQAVTEFKQATLDAGDDPEHPENKEIEEAIRKEVPRSRVIESRPTLTVYEPYDVHLPPNVTDVDETPWFALTRRERLDEVRVNDLYISEAREKVCALKMDPDAAQRRTEEDGPVAVADEVARIVHFYDVRAHRIVIFDEASKTVLFDGENPAECRDVPLIHLRAFRDGAALRGFGDLENIIGSYEKLHRVDKMQQDNLHNQGNVFVVRQDVLTDEERRKLAVARPGDLITLSEVPEGMPLNQVIEALPQQALQADVYQARAQYLEDAASGLGLNEYQMGGTGPSRGSGTQAAVVDGMQSMKSRERQESYEIAFTRIANLFLKLSRQYLDTPVVVAIVGPAGSNWDNLRTISKSDITGDFTLMVRQGSLSGVNPATKAQRGMERLTLAQTLAQTGLFETTGIENLMQMALRDMGLDPDLIGLALKPQQPVAPAPTPAAPGAMDPSQGLPPEVMAAAGGGMPQFDPAMLDAAAGADMSGQMEAEAAGGPPLDLGMDGFAF